MFSKAAIRGVPFRPALFCAPLAGLTHSAFRRVVAEFGGCGGFWTEMLAARQILRENEKTSPYLKRSPAEQRVIYQLMIRETDPIEQIAARVSEIGPDGIDLNLACHAPMIRKLDAGSRLFEDAPALARVLQVLRGSWAGLLTVKIRLGRDMPDWKAHFTERMKLFEGSGVDAVVVHPRFFEDKFKRRARLELIPWIASLTRLPLIVSGDIAGPEILAKKAEWVQPAAGLMIGRAAVAQPWIFAAWGQPLNIDYAAVWSRMADAICEDFSPEVAITRVKLFTKYYARNFHFGHGFYTSVYHAETLEAVRERAAVFFAKSPAIHAKPELMGL